MLIRIQSTAHREDSHMDEDMDLLVSGVVFLEKDSARLVYDEQIDDKPEHVEMLISQNTVMVNRSGEFSSQMSFRMGARSEGIYQTPIGNMELATFCSRLSYDLTEQGGIIQIVYQLDMNGHFAAVHEIEISLLPENE